MRMRSWHGTETGRVPQGAVSNTPDEEARRVEAALKARLKELIRPSEVYVGLNIHLLLDTL